MSENDKEEKKEYKIKLVFVATTVYSSNSALCAHLCNLADEFEVILCTNLTTGILSPEITKKVNTIHIDIERKINIRKDIIALFQILKILNKLSPGAVHSVTPKAGLLLMWASYLLGIPNRFHTFTGQVWTNHKGLKRRFLIFFDKLIVIFASSIFADGLSQCDFLAEEGVILRNKISVLGGGSISGVDINKFKENTDVRYALRNKYNIPSDCCIFLFVGRLVRDKGIEDLVKSFNEILAYNPKIALWLVGPDEELTKQKIFTKFHNLEKVEFIGGQSNPQDYMAACDVLVLPSYREGFSTVVIEAAACMLPTIGYNINGIKDPVVDNETGLLVDKGDVKELAKAMLELSNNPSKRKAMGHKARRRVELVYSQDRISSAWKQLYLDIFSGQLD